MGRMIVMKPSWTPIGARTLKDLGRRSDIALVCAPWGTDENPHGKLYLRMNKNFPREKGWTTLCGPQWIGDRFVIPMIRPRDDSDQGWMDVAEKWQQERYRKKESQP